MVAFMSFTASQIETTVGFCAIAPGSCASFAWIATDPLTPTFTNALPGGRSSASRAGHDPVAGSVAPMPTVSDAPIATYRTAGGAVVIGVGVGVGVVVGATVAAGVGVGADAVAALRVGPPQDASTAMRRNRESLRIVRIDGA